MEKYNNSHCVDLTAAIAISRADGKPCMVRQPYETWCGLTYKIGEIYFMRMVGNLVLVIDRARNDSEWYKINQALGTNWLDGIDTPIASRRG